MEDFIKMLKGVKPDIDFEHETALVDDGLLESLDIISIISEISEVYGVWIPSDEIIPDNFNSAEAWRSKRSNSLWNGAPKELLPMPSGRSCLKTVGTHWKRICWSFRKTWQ